MYGTHTTFNICIEARFMSCEETCVCVEARLVLWGDVCLGIQTRRSLGFLHHPSRPPMNSHGS